MYQVQHLVWWYLMGAAAPWFVEQPQQATRPVDHEIVLSESHLAAVNLRRRICDVDPSCVVGGPITSICAFPETWSQRSESMCATAAEDEAGWGIMGVRCGVRTSSGETG